MWSPTPEGQGDTVGTCGQGVSTLCGQGDTVGMVRMTRWGNVVRVTRWGLGDTCGQDETVWSG